MNQNKKYNVPSIFDDGFLPSFLRQISLFDDENSGMAKQNTNISVSEDEMSVYIDAHLPGVQEKDIEVTQDKGILWIRGEAKEEESDSKKKYYYKAARSFSYRVAIPGNIDETKTPKATYENGVLHISYPKLAIEGPKKIEITSKS
jgi:HSP20 family protein